MNGPVLVTGATGFVGPAATAALAGTPGEVHAVWHTRRPPEGDGAHWHHCDLLRAGAAEALIDAVRPSHLLHLAWYTAPRLFWSSGENLRWVEASLRLVRAFTGAGGRRVVVAGSCAEYTPAAGEPCSEAATARRPESLYGVAKNALHELLASHAAAAGYGLAWARIFHVYGPGEPHERLVPSAIRSLLEQRRFEATGPDRELDFMFVDDVGAALARLLFSDLTGPVNIGSGEATRVSRLLGTIAARLGPGALVGIDGASREATALPDPVVADVARLRGELGWSPAVSLYEGIDRTIGWWRPRAGNHALERLSRGSA